MLLLLQMLMLLLASLASAAAPIRVSCVGDSITTSTCGGTEGGYQIILQKELMPAGKFLVTGFGSSGMTMLKEGTINGGPEGGGTYWNTSAFQRALNSTPDIVTIMLGTNDAKEGNWFGVQDNKTVHDSFVSDYKDMIALFAALPSKPKIFLAVPPPLYPPFPYNMNATVINTIFPKLIRQLTTETVAESTVIDVYSAFRSLGTTGQTCISCDGCHPHGNRAYRVVAAAFAAVLNPHGAPPSPPSDPLPPLPKGIPSKPAGGVLLYQRPADGNGSVLVPFADFVPSCGHTSSSGAKAEARLAWDGCNGRDLQQRKLYFMPNGGPIWESIRGSHIGAFKVVDPSGKGLTVGFAGPCTGDRPGGLHGGSVNLTVATAASGTVKAIGENLYFETELAPEWAPICCGGGV